MSINIEAVALDKDGVIFDSEKLYAKGLTIAAEQMEIELPDGFHEKILGLSADKILSIMTQLWGEDTAHYFCHEKWLPTVYHLMDTEGLDFISGAESLIETLHAQGYPLALVTNDGLDNLILDVNRTRPDLLNYFSVVITRDDVNQGKPHPEPYERAAALLGVPTEQLLVIEDSDNGAKSACGAGANVLLLANNREVPQEISDKVHLVIKNHSDVFSMLS